MFDLLPVPIIQSILKSFSDPTPLPSFIRTCQAVFRAFKGQERVIVAHILLKEIDRDVVPEASILVRAQQLALSSGGRDLDTNAIQSWELGGRPKWTILNFFRQELFMRRPPEVASLECNLPDGLRLHRSLETIKYLSVAFFIDAFKRNYNLKLWIKPDQRPNKPVSRAEACRMQRAFCLFEIFTTLVDVRAVDDHPQEYHREFEKYFSPWETEQIVCVQEFLTRCSVILYNNAVEHDVHFGSIGVPYLDPISPKSMDIAEALIVPNARPIYDCIRATTFDQRVRITAQRLASIHERKYPRDKKKQHAFDQTGYPSRDNTRGLSRWVPDPQRWRQLDGGTRPVISTLNLDQNALLQGTPFYNSRNGTHDEAGSRYMWNWRYRNFPCSEYLGSPRTIFGRAWAYPFWDMQRVAATGIAGEFHVSPVVTWSAEFTRDADLEDETDVAELPKKLYDPLLQHYRQPRTLRNLLESQRWRREIYQAGGRGYWAWGNGSQVVYRGRRPG